MSYPSATPTSHSTAITCFSVKTDAAPTTLARVLEVFALREVMPTRFHSMVDPGPASDSEPDCLSVDIQVAGFAPDPAAAIMRKLAAVVGVRSVSTGAG